MERKRVLDTHAVGHAKAAIRLGNSNSSEGHQLDQAFTPKPLSYSGQLLLLVGGVWIEVRLRPGSQYYTRPHVTLCPSHTGVHHNARIDSDRIHAFLRVVLLHMVIKNTNL